MEEKLLLNETVYLTVHGSRAYGTHRPDSDRDERGFCILSDPRYYFGFKNFEQKDAGWSDQIDRCIFDIRKFFTLALDCNPNIIEILFSDESDLIICKDAGRLVRDNREMFLSKKAADKFVGYAMSQLHRMEGHYNWRQNPPEKPTDITFIKEIALEAGSPNPFRIELESHLFTVMPPAQGSISITHFDKNAFKTANKKYTQYLDWIKNRNEVRAKLEEEFSYDSKHAMHLIRLLKMGKEIITTGEVKVRRPDAPELKDIRNGKFKYPELINYAQELKNEIGEQVEHSPLPDEPDSKAAEELLVNLITATLARK